MEAKSLNNCVVLQYTAIIGCVSCSSFIQNVSINLLKNTVITIGLTNIEKVNICTLRTSWIILFPKHLSK